VMRRMLGQHELRGAAAELSGGARYSKPRDHDRTILRRRPPNEARSASVWAQ
jgi:hypothetical protein